MNLRLPSAENAYFKEKLTHSIDSQCLTQLVRRARVRMQHRWQCGVIFRSKKLPNEFVLFARCLFLKTTTDSNYAEKSERIRRSAKHVRTIFPTSQLIRRSTCSTPSPWSLSSRTTASSLCTGRVSPRSGSGGRRRRGMLGRRRHGEAFLLLIGGRGRAGAMRAVFPPTSLPPATTTPAAPRRH